MISVYGPGCLGAPTCDPMGAGAPQWLLAEYSGVYLYELRGIQCGNHGGEFCGGFFDRVVRLHLSSTSASLHRRLLV